MEIALSSGHKIKLKNNEIIGLMGPNFDQFLLSIKGDVTIIDNNYYFYTNNVQKEINLLTHKEVDEALIKDLGLSRDFLKKEISDLGDGDKHLLKYLIGIMENKRDIFILEPFLDIDYYYKKKIISLLHKLVNQDHKTIIIGSNNSNIIYSLCKSVLLIKDDKYYYDKCDNIFNNAIINEYKIDLPIMISFYQLLKDKGVSINNRKDIRDLIKDVYKNVKK